VQSGLSGFNADTGRQTHDGPELSGVALVQYVIGQFGSQRGRDSDGNKHFRGILKEHAVEVPRGDSYDGRLLPVHPEHLPHCIGRGVEAIAPETIADHDRWEIAGPVEFGAEEPSALWSYAEHGKIIG